MKKFALFLVAGIFLCTAAGSVHALGLSVENRVYNSTLDHWYYLVVYDTNDADPTIPDKSWDSADSFITSLNDPYFYLATITSAAEQNIMESLFAADDRREFWLGGFQDPSTETDANAGWSWVTGETWDYANWGSGEPNDTNGLEQNLATWGRSSWQWNDEGDLGNIAGFIVEYGEYDTSTPVPEPATMLLLGAGLLGLAGFNKRRKIKV